MFENMQFETEEATVITVRTHVLIVGTHCVWIGIIFLIPFLFSVLANTVPAFALFATLLSYLPAGSTSFLAAVWTLLFWMALGSVWTNYYLNNWTVTTKRVIVVVQRGLFNRSVSSFRLERLQDIEVDVNGIVATMFDYGTIHTETAGHEEAPFTMHGVPHPQEIKSIILTHADALMQPRSV